MTNRATDLPSPYSETPVQGKGCRGCEVPPEKEVWLLDLGIDTSRERRIINSARHTYM